MKNKDVFPSDEPGFDSFQDNLVKQATANKVAWVIDAAQLGLLTPLQAKWALNWAICKVKTNATTAQRKAKNQAKAAYKKQLRIFIKGQIQGNVNMTDDERILCGVTPHKTTRTPAVKPDTTPTVTVETANGEVAHIFCKQQQGNDGSSLRAKPDGIKKVKVVYIVSATAPASPAACINTVYSGKTKITLQFDVADAGKKFYGFACWVNSKDEQGPWSVLFSGSVS